MHEHDDHVDAVVIASLAQRPLEPDGLEVGRSGAEVGDRGVVRGHDLQVASVGVVIGDGAVRDLGTGARRLGHGVRGRVEVGRAAVLVDDVVGVQGDELHGADLEGVEVAAQVVAVVVGHAVVRQQEAAEVVAVSVRAVPVVARGTLGRDAARCVARLTRVVAGAELGLVVAEGRHPRPVLGGPAGVDAEVPPDARGVHDVEVGVAQVAVEQMEQRRPVAVAWVLDRVHGEEGVVAGLVPDVAGLVQVPRRGREVAVAGEAVLGAASWRRLEARAGRRRRCRAVADLVVVARAWLEVPELDVVVVRRLGVQAIGEEHRGRLRIVPGDVELLGLGEADDPARVTLPDRGTGIGQRRRRLGHGAWCEPGHGDVSRRVLAPGQPQLLGRGSRWQRKRRRRRSRRCCRGEGCLVRERTVGHACQARGRANDDHTAEECAAGNPGLGTVTGGP